MLRLFYSAAAVNDLDTLKAWHAAGADLNISDYDHRTPLHIVSAAQIIIWGWG